MRRVLKSIELSSRELNDFDRETLEDENEVRDPRALMEEARVEAEAKVREAYAEGLRRGQASGEERFRESVGEAAEMLSRASEAMGDARENYLDVMTPQVVALAHAIAARILEREVKLDSEVVLTSARKALAHLLDRERLTLRVNPADLETLRSHKVALLEEFEGTGSLVVVEDDSVSSGGCVVESDTMEADARMESQLEAVLEALME